jgi:hypothetical protein
VFYERPCPAALESLQSVHRWPRQRKQSDRSGAQAYRLGALSARSIPHSSMMASCGPKCPQHLWRASQAALASTRMLAPMPALLAGKPDALVIGLMLGALGTMTLSYLLTARYLRKRVGVQPAYKGLVIMLTTAACFGALLYAAKQAGFDLLHGRPRDVFWLILGAVWIITSARVLYERQTSGAVLMDLGRTPIAKIHLGLAVVMAVAAVGLGVSGDSPTQSVAYGAWAVWCLVMARGRLQIREYGIMTTGTLRWQRIVRCVAKDRDKVHLHLNKGWQRDIDINVPADVRDEFLRIIEQRTGVAAAQ